MFFTSDTHWVWTSLSGRLYASCPVSWCLPGLQDYALASQSPGWGWTGNLENHTLHTWVFHSKAPGKVCEVLCFYPTTSGPHEICCLFGRSMQRWYKVSHRLSEVYWMLLPCLLTDVHVVSSVWQTLACLQLLELGFSAIKTELPAKKSYPSPKKCFFSHICQWLLFDTHLSSSV